MSNQKIATYFTNLEPMGYPFNKEPYAKAYQYLTQKIEELNAELFFVRGMDSYQGAGRFSHSWKFVDGKLVETGALTADVLYDKSNGGTHFPRETGLKIVNPAAINEVCENKQKTYELFPEMSPQTFFLSNVEELLQLKTIFRGKFVLKPHNGDEGNGVLITDDWDQVLSREWDFPLLLQEFLDSSVGIPGVVDSTHDLRLVYIEDELVDAFVRTPAEGKLVCNYSQGGAIQVLELSKVPQSALEFGEVVHSKLRHLAAKSVVSIDMCHTATGWKLIELNDKSGLPTEEDRYHFIDKLAAFLVGF